jgi:opacity protein-like surface antigen
MHRFALGAFAALGILIASSAVVAADVAPPESQTTATDQMNLPKGTFLIDGFITMNLSNNQAFQPVSITPDIWYGVTDDLTVGLVHSFVGESGLVGFTGDSLCLTGSNNGCPNFYQDVGVDLRYRLKAPLSVDAGVFVDQLSNPFLLGVKVGIDGRWRFGKAAIEIQPNLFVELTNRVGGAAAMGTTPAIPGNEEDLAIPVTGSYTVIPNLDVMLQVGLLLPFDQTGDFFQIPVSIGARYAVSPKLSLGLMFSLTELAGGSARDTGFDTRVLTVGGSYAL